MASSTAPLIPDATGTRNASAGATPGATPPCTSLPLSTSLFDAQFGRWLERRLQRWTDVAVSQGEARWARESGLHARYY